MMDAENIDMCMLKCERNCQKNLSDFIDTYE